ncbi:protein CDV3 homolog isoform X2 [Ischnura elegans]|uniref:protein CDV3 homolog isoform X2 n=1 Tax=Ischnura elegans TaxID=197161 RepID=UPI001ED87D09|nr:protein CDV3 homolog isoform X2 [Ischnura elegans]
MADLDDFFAKKDKRKAKGKKFTTADEIAKKLEETGKKTKDTKKEKEKISLPVSTPGQENEEPVQQPQQEDDEWKEFEEEKKDYSGLKIQNLQLSDPEEEGEDDEEEEEHENEAGEKVMRKKVPAGPWKMPQPEKPEEVSEEDKDEEKGNEEKKDDKPAGSDETGGSSYIPPHIRFAQQQPLAPMKMGRGKPKTAPDINNEEYFPTLSASKTAEPAGAWGKRRDNERGFEEVRNSKSHSSRGPGGISSDLGRGNGSRLTLGNKYGALDQS